MGINITNGIPSEIYVGIGRERYEDQYEVAAEVAEWFQSRINELEQQFATANAEIERLRKNYVAAKNENISNSTEIEWLNKLVIAANEGRPLGPVIGAQTILEQEIELKQLREENAELKKVVEQAVKWLDVMGKANDESWCGRGVLRTL